MTKNVKAYLAWFSVALYFYYQYILRVSPGVMITDLRAEFQLTAEQFSTLGSLYLYTYSLMQIPLGLIVDRFGVRPTVLGSILLSIAGVVLLSVTQSFWGAQVSRILVGMGSACAFMGALKVAADHLPPGKRALLMGATLSLGTLGALTAGKPLVYLVELTDWRYATLISGLGGVGILAICWIFLPKRSEHPEVEPFNTTRVTAKILGALANPQIMLYAFLAIGVYTPLSVFTDLWGTAFLMEKFHISRAEAAPINTLMYIGLAAGALVLPWWTEKMGKLDRGIQISSVALLFVFSIILYGPMLPSWALISLLILVGFFCGAEMMCFTGAALNTTRENSGISLGVVNTLNMLGGAVLQNVIGVGLDLQWEGTYETGGLRAYSLEQYTFALSSLLVIIAVCAAASLSLNRKMKRAI